MYAFARRYTSFGRHYLVVQVTLIPVVFVHDRVFALRGLEFDPRVDGQIAVDAET